MAGKYNRVIRKLGRRAYKAAGVKNPMKKGKISSSRVLGLANKVRQLATMVNAEKKRIHLVSAADQEVGQVNVDNSGHWLLDITPNPAQGVTTSTKTGNSIKLHASHFDFQFTSQANTISGMRLKMQIVKVVGLNYTNINDILGKFVVPNRFITSHTIYDINSDRDQDYFRNFQVLKTKYISVKNEDIANQVSMARVKFGMKYKSHHVRTNDDTTTVSMGQIFLLITADRGNAGGSVSTITRVPITQANTAVDMAYNIDHYFYDN